MEKLFKYKNKIFSYYVAGGNYAVITHVTSATGSISFVKSQDGYYKHVIEVPTSIDGFPVMAVLDLKLDLALEGEGRYRHDGSRVLSVSLPEYASFGGFKKVQTKVGYLYPDYTVSYYPRSDTGFLFCKTKNAAFFAKPLSDKNCEMAFVFMERSEGELTLEIPETVCGYTVTEIAADSTKLLPENLSVLKLNNSIEYIGKNCFTGLPCLGKVYLGEKVVRIDDGAFGYYEENAKPGLKKVNTLRVYYKTAFKVSDTAFDRKADAWVEDEEFCGDYTRFKIENIRYGVEFAAFEQCEFVVDRFVLKECNTNLTQVNLPKEIKSIAKDSFSNNSFIEKVVLPLGLKEIGDGAFKGCSSLKEIDIPNSVKTIGSSAFADCGELETVKLPDHMKELGKGVFENCTKLKNVHLPKDVKRIKYHAFAHCKSLKVPRLPNGVIADIYAFENCLSEEPSKKDK